MKYQETESRTSPHLNRAIVERATAPQDLDTLPLSCNEDECFVTLSEFGLPVIGSAANRIAADSK